MDYILFLTLTYQPQRSLLLIFLFIRSLWLVTARVLLTLVSLVVVLLILLGIFCLFLHLSRYLGYQIPELIVNYL